MVRPARPPLTLELVLTAAVDLADDGGLVELKMRALAARLEIEAMSLYHYVPSKDALLAGILDRVVSQISLDVGPDWRASVRGIALSTFRALERHPWAAVPLLSASSPVPGRLRQMDALLGCLRRGGFSLEASELAYHALDSHIMGFTLWGLGLSEGLKEFRSDPARVIAQLGLHEHDHLAEHIELHRRGESASSEATFEFVLDLILDGLERVRVAP